MKHPITKPRANAKQRADRAQKLHSGHFAFMRAVVQGLDASEAWERYLSFAGERIDARTVTSTIAWIRTEFAAAARRQAKPGTARLVLIDATSIGDAPQVPTLEEFACARGLEDFSHDEQVAAFSDEYGGATGKSKRRARLILRQLEALRWLEDLVAQAPAPEDL